MFDQTYKPHCFLTARVQSANSSPESPGKVSVLIKSMRAPLALKVALLGEVGHPCARGAGIKNPLKEQELEYSRMRTQLGDTPRSLGVISQMNQKNVGVYQSSEPQKRR